MKKAFDSGSLQHSVQTLKNASESEMANILQGEDSRLHQDFVRSYNDTQSSVDQWRAAHTKHEALSNLQSYSSSDSFTVQQHLNQRFVEFLKTKYEGDIGRINTAIDMPLEALEKQELYREFANDFFPKNYRGTHSPDMGASYAAASAEVAAREPQTASFDQARTATIAEGEQKIGHSFGQSRSKVEAFQERVQENTSSYIREQDSKSKDALQNYDEEKHEAKHNLNRTVPGQFLRKAKSLGPVRAIYNWTTSNYNELFGEQKED